MRNFNSILYCRRIIDNDKIHVRIASLLIELYGGIGSKVGRPKAVLISDMQQQRNSGTEPLVQKQYRERAEEELRQAEWYWGDISK